VQVITLRLASSAGSILDSICDELSEACVPTHDGAVAERAGTAVTESASAAPTQTPSLEAVRAPDSAAESAGSGTQDGVSQVAGGCEVISLQTALFHEGFPI
jgi:hypothetical protein